MSAQVRSIANRNEALGLPPVPNPGPVYVTKDDASEAQSAESRVYGGQNPRGGMAAQMQVSALQKLTRLIAVVRLTEDVP